MLRTLYVGYACESPLSRLACGLAWAYQVQHRSVPGNQERVYLYFSWVLGSTDRVCLGRADTTLLCVCIIQQFMCVPG